jgi:exodeoxyribonuclease-3
MLIATYNVNGIGARLPRLLEWLEERKPDVACLQEIKCVGEKFPADAVRDAGYHAIVSGQPGFNGVAILTREPAEEVQRGLPGDDEDMQARYLEADVGGVRVASIYLPNGNPVPGPKFDYKLAWMERLHARAELLWTLERPVVLAGDYNVCPTDEDLFSVQALANDALAQPESRSSFRRLVNRGWTDALRVKQSQGRIYTFWDYQAGAWQRDAGLRIDHLLLSPQAADKFKDAQVDKHIRGKERASDHAPTWVELDF